MNSHLSLDKKRKTIYSDTLQFSISLRFPSKGYWHFIMYTLVNGVLFSLCRRTVISVYIVESWDMVLRLLSIQLESSTYQQLVTNHSVTTSADQTAHLSMMSSMSMAEMRLVLGSIVLFNKFCTNVFSIGSLNHMFSFVIRVSN